MCLGPHGGLVGETGLQLSVSDACSYACEEKFATLGPLLPQKLHVA